MIQTVWVHAVVIAHSTLKRVEYELSKLSTLKPNLLTWDGGVMYIKIKHMKIFYACVIMLMIVAPKLHNKIGHYENLTWKVFSYHKILPTYSTFYRLVVTKIWLVRLNYKCVMTTVCHGGACALKHIEYLVLFSGVISLSMLSCMSFCDMSVRPDKSF